MYHWDINEQVWPIHFTFNFSSIHSKISNHFSLVITQFFQKKEKFIIGQNKTSIS